MSLLRRCTSFSYVYKLCVHSVVKRIYNRIGRDTKHATWWQRWDGFTTALAFDFKNPVQWPQWKRRFEEYRTATALDAESETRQVSMLLNCMGKTAGDV